MLLNKKNDISAGRHPGESRGPENLEEAWIPAFAGMTVITSGEVSGFMSCSTYFVTSPKGLPRNNVGILL